MASAKRPKIVVIKEDFKATDIAGSEVSPMVSGANVMEAVSSLATDITPTETDIFASDELNFVTANLTDKEAKDLASKPGVLAVEDDEEVFAYGGEEDDLGDIPIDVDAEASEAIEASEADVEDLTEEEARALAGAETVRPVPSFDDVEFDEMGQLLRLDDGVDPALLRGRCGHLHRTPLHTQPQEDRPPAPACHGLEAAKGG